VEGVQKSRCRIRSRDLDPPDLYLIYDRIKKRLGADFEERIALLQRGLALDPLNDNILYALNLMLLKESRYDEALANLEKYVSEKQTDIRANLEIMRLLIMAPDEKARDPKLGKEYCTWFLNNIKRNNEVILLLIQAHIHLGEIDEAWDILSRTNTRDLPQNQKIWLERMISEVRDLKSKK